MHALLFSIARAWCTVVAVSPLGICVACRTSDSAPPPPKAEPTMVAPQAVTAALTEDTTHKIWLERELGELRDRTIKWAPRQVPLQQMVFAGDRLLSVMQDEIVSVPVGKQGEARRYQKPGRVRLTTLADLSVLAIGTEGTLLIKTDAKAVQAPKAVLLMPEEQLFGNAGVPGCFDGFESKSGRWTSYTFNDHPSVTSIWLPDRNFELAELKQGHCAQLINGTFACVAHDQMWHGTSHARARPLGRVQPGAAVWRVLPGPRADQSWVARVDGTLERYWLAQPPKYLGSVQLPWMPLDVSVNPDIIAVIQVEQARPQAKMLKLTVLETNGRVRSLQPLETEIDAAPNAVEQELLASEVVVHPNEPWVAVRTSHGARVIDANTGAILATLQ